MCLCQHAWKSGIIPLGILNNVMIKCGIINVLYPTSMVKHE